METSVAGLQLSFTPRLQPGGEKAPYMGVNRFNGFPQNLFRLRRKSKPLKRFRAFKNLRPHRAEAAV